MSQNILSRLGSLCLPLLVSAAFLQLTVWILSASPFTPLFFFTHSVWFLPDSLPLHFPPICLPVVSAFLAEKHPTGSYVNYIVAWSATLLHVAAGAPLSVSSCTASSTGVLVPPHAASLRPHLGHSRSLTSTRRSLPCSW